MEPPIAKADSQILEIKTNKGIKYIALNRLIYVKAENRGSILHLENSEQISTKHYLKWYHNKLSVPEFFRCHNSYLVNCRFVDCFCSQEIVLLDNQRIPLSRYKTQSFKENLIDLQLKVNYCQEKQKYIN
jgi:DNA-binding LytR/AlgR family response regulator